MADQRDLELGVWDEEEGFVPEGGLIVADVVRDVSQMEWGLWDKENECFVAVGDLTKEEVRRLLGEPTGREILELLVAGLHAVDRPKWDVSKAGDDDSAA